ncbi:MAG: hypothetical protein R3E98_00410 [Gemmatimonadota bacterium]|nr:hypothetical protein [Gemmatimonadota bacterium]
MLRPTLPLLLLALPLLAARPASSGPRATLSAVALEVDPRGGPEGAKVTVTVRDLTGRTPIVVGFGGIGSPHEILGEGVSDEDGLVRVEAEIPSWVEPGRTYLFYMAYADQRPVRFADPFLVTEADGTVRVQGTVGTEGSCTTLHMSETEVFGLTGEAARALPAGERVGVHATLAPAATCGGLLTLRVTRAEPMGGPS